MKRYSIIEKKNKREMVLLKGKPCIYGKCSFCNYILDNSNDIAEINNCNMEILSEINGIYNVLEVVNSGSVFELPDETLSRIREMSDQNGIETIYFEAYISYIKRLNEIIDFFPNQEIRFRLGIETFDDEFRRNILNKNFSISDSKVFEDIRNKYWGVLLMICIQGQTKEQILLDIKTAADNFQEITISVFNDNGTVVKQDKELTKWFVEEIYPSLQDKHNIEVLISNQDLGVYVQ